MDITRTSKTLSYWLRHRPDEAGLVLDPQGWVSVDDILAALRARQLVADFDALFEVVERNDKQRFEFSPDLSRIRARQGHSVAIDLALSPLAPPDTLFHGTVERFIAAILSDGLLKMARHHVHLSAEIATAQKVGARRGAPVILEVSAGAMARESYAFFQSANGVWLTETVPPRFLRRL